MENEKEIVVSEDECFEVSNEDIVDEVVEETVKPKANKEEINAEISISSLFLYLCGN